MLSEGSREFQGDFLVIGAFLAFTIVYDVISITTLGFLAIYRAIVILLSL
jgi:hypothetical protein